MHARGESKVEQLILDIVLEQGIHPAIPLDPRLREELAALMAAAIVAVDQARGDQCHDELDA
jgi:hypothetical protein